MQGQVKAESKLEEAPAPARENIAGLSEAEANRRLAQYGENALAEHRESAFRAAWALFLGAHPMDDRSRGRAVGRAWALGGPRHHPGDALHQRRRRLLAGIQGGQCHCLAEAAACAQGARQARRPNGRRSTRSCSCPAMPCWSSSATSFQPI